MNTKDQFKTIENTQDNINLEELLTNEPIQEENNISTGDILSDLISQAEEEEEDVNEEENGEDFDSDILFEGVEIVENMNISLCLAISGESDPKKYKQSEDKKRKFAEKLERYLQKKGFKISPEAGLFISALILFGSPVLQSYMVRLKKQKEEAARREREAEVQIQREQEEALRQQQENNKPFSTGKEHSLNIYENLKEYKEKRISFKTHANGTYKHPAETTKIYLKVDEATETPSLIIQKLIDEGKTCEEIRSILGYEIDKK